MRLALLFAAAMAVTIAAHAGWLDFAVLFRLYRWRRQSGASRTHALARAWAKWREPDPFLPLSKRKS